MNQKYKRLTPRHDFFEEVPEFYYAHLSLRQWRIIITSLTDSETEEAQSLASDLQKYILPNLGTG
jgi:hypothetical protein